MQPSTSSRQSLLAICALFLLSCGLRTSASILRGTNKTLDAPVLTFRGDEDLPRGCVSYADRYGRYIQPNMMSTMFDPNDLYPDAKHVFVVKLHYGIKWKRDLVLFLLSTAHELSAAGMHMYMLVQDSQMQASNTDDTPEKFRNSLPIPLRPMLFLFDEEDVHNAYPGLHEFRHHIRDYLPFVYFLHRFPGYEFAWYMEYDVRYTGPSLADFLQSLLDIADLRLRTRQAEQEQLEQHEPHQSRRELREAEPEKEGVHVEQEPLIPDLLYMGPDLGEGMKITDEVKPRDYHPDHWNLTQFHAAGLMLQGWSRNFAQTMHAWSQEGKGGYLEEFVPSLAASNKLASVGVANDEYYGPSFHCCFGPTTSERFYQEFHMHKSRCFPYALLHPIKLTSPYWESEPVFDGVSHTGGL